jgi:hypothetical protein
MGLACGLMHWGADYYEELAQKYLNKRDKICEALGQARLSTMMRRARIWRDSALPNQMPCWMKPAGKSKHWELFEENQA